jgi:hypothetical protein
MTGRARSARTRGWLMRGSLDSLQAPKGVKSCTDLILLMMSVPAWSTIAEWTISLENEHFFSQDFRSSFDTWASPRTLGHWASAHFTILSTVSWDTRKMVSLKWLSIRFFINLKCESYVQITADSVVKFSRQIFQFESNRAAFFVVLQDDFMKSCEQLEKKMQKLT